MNGENIKLIFENYLNTGDTHYAILLNGSWGSGKTYFWKCDLDKLAQEKGFKTIYISLNGMSKIENLEHNLFIKLLPWIGKQEGKTAKNTATLVTNAINHVSKYFLKASLSDIFKGVSVDSFNFSKYIICFDDLERCQIPIKEVLGFINNYVEHKGLKTIILADEKNMISQEEEKGYDNIKEKVIGRILNYNPDIRNVLPELFKKYETNNPKFYAFLQKREKTIYSIILEFEQDNLRIISCYLDSLEYIFPSLENIEDRYIQEIVLFTAIISIEFKLGELKSSDYDNTKGLNNIDEHFSSLNWGHTLGNNKNEGSDKKEKTYVQKFSEKYLNNRATEYFFYNSIYTLILTGYLDKNLLNKEIKKRYPEVVLPEILNFRRLLNYKFIEIEDIDFKKLTEEVLRHANKGVYSIYDYVRIAHFYYFFIKNKLITISKEEVDKIITDGLEIAKTRKEINTWMMENQLHFSDENKDVTLIKEKVKSIHDKIKQEEYKSDSQELISILKGTDEKKLAIFLNEQRFSKELFQYVDRVNLFETILTISNKQLFNLTELLKDRYSSVNIGEFIYEDKTLIVDLQREIELHFMENEEVGQPKLFLLKTLSDSLIEISNHLERTKTR